MPTYLIEVQRTSYVDVEVEADSQADAESKAWDEVATRGDSGYADWEITQCRLKGEPQ